MGDASVFGEDGVPSRRAGAHPLLLDLLQQPAGGGRLGEQRTDRTVDELHGAVPRRFPGSPGLQVAAEPPEQLPVGRVEHRPRPRRRVDGVVDHQRQGASGPHYPGRLAEEAGRVLDVFQGQHRVGAVHRPVPQAGQARQAVEEHRMAAGGPAGQRGVDVHTHRLRPPVGNQALDAPVPAPQVEQHPAPQLPQHLEEKRDHLLLVGRILRLRRPPLGQFVPVAHLPGQPASLSLEGRKQDPTRVSCYKVCWIVIG